MAAVVDYTEAYRRACGLGKELLRCEGRGQNLLILRRLEQPRRRMDGKMATRLLQDHTLSVNCETPEDEAWACIRGDDYILWQKTELDPVPGQSLFDLVRLFP